MTQSDFSELFLQQVSAIADALPADEIDRMAETLAELRECNGRLFIIGSGGGAGHASHAVCDFRKLCEIEAYAPTDNVSELTARTNDEGWDTTVEAWLRTSRISGQDAVLVFSVGGGSREHNISMNLVRAVELAKEVGATVLGIVGKSDGTTAQLADAAVVVPAPAEHLTALVESYQAIIWHLLVFHPRLALQAGKWESVTTASA